MNDINIVAYDEIREKIDEVKEACNFLPDVSSADGYDKSKRVALDVGKILTSLEKARKAEKAHWIEGGKQVDVQAKKIVSELEGYQLPHKEAYKELDNLKKEREAKRKADLEERVREIRELPEVMRDHDSEGLKLAMVSMQEEECLDFYEYSMAALEARNATRDALGELYVKALASEKEAVELAALRAEKEARDKAEHEENIRREASAKAEQEAAAAKDREEQAKKALIMAKEQAEVARLAEINRQAETKRIEDEAQAAREANKKHVGKVRREAKEALMNFGRITEAQAKAIIMAINNKDIPHISIKY